MPELEIESTGNTNKCSILLPPRTMTEPDTYPLMLHPSYFAADPISNLVTALRSTNINQPTDAAMILTEPLTSLLERNICKVSSLSGRSKDFLAEAITESRLSFDPSTQSVRDQHFVSATLLRQFEESTPIGERLLRYDLRSGFARGLKTASHTFRLFDFVKIDSSTTEKLWASTETNFPDLLRELEGSPTRLEDWAKELLLNFVALHLARSLLVRNVHEEVWRNRSATFAKDLVPANVTVAYFIGRHHLYPPSTHVAMKEFAREFHQRSVAKFDNGLTFRLRVVSAFHDYRALLGQGEIIICAFPPSTDLIVSDTPTVTIVHAGLERVTQNRNSLDNRAIFMPLAPSIGVAFVGKGWTNHRLLEDASTLNRIALMNATDGVIMRPSAGLRSWCETVRPFSRQKRETARVGEA